MRQILMAETDVSTQWPRVPEVDCAKGSKRGQVTRSKGQPVELIAAPFSGFIPKQTDGHGQFP